MCEASFKHKGTVLYGMKNAGKTVLGKRLSKDLMQPFVDTDDLIQARNNRHPVEIIRDPRKLNFQAFQRAAILRHRPSQPEVIATGGSAALDPEIVEHLGQYGVGIFIDVKNDDLKSRFLRSEMEELFNPENLSFDELCDQRREIYEYVADYTIPVEPGETVQSVSFRLHALRSHISA